MFWDLIFFILDHEEIRKMMMRNKDQSKDRSNYGYLNKYNWLLQKNDSLKMKHVKQNDNNWSTINQESIQFMRIKKNNIQKFSYLIIFPYFISWQLIFKLFSKMFEFDILLNFIRIYCCFLDDDKIWKRKSNFESCDCLWSYIISI